MPLISIIVPVYKVEPYLRKCLDSIIGQTYRHLEIILVDDGSPDKCGEICDEYASKDERIIVIHQENAGLSAARNAALDIARGDYLMFVDSDDWIEKKACESVLSVAQLQHADIVCYGYNEISASGFVYETQKGTPGEIDRKEILRGIIKGDMFTRDYVWNKFIDRKLFDGIRFPVGRLYEDIGTSYKLFHLAEKVWISDDVLYNYVKERDGSITKYSFLLNHLEDRLAMLKERSEFLKDYYPDFVDLQVSMMIRELLINRDKIEEKQARMVVNELLAQIVGTYRSRIPFLTEYSKVVWVFYYCPLLLTPFLKLRRCL